MSAVALLMGLAVILPRWQDWKVSVSPFTPGARRGRGLRALGWAPLRAEWDPRLGPGSLAAFALGTCAVLYAGQLCSRWRWRRMLAMMFVLAAAWSASLATVDGLEGIGRVLDTGPEYLQTAREVADLSTLLSTYVDRIPETASGSWPVHVAGHPPGALLFFVLLVAIGLGSGLAAGVTVLLLGATTPLAVLITLRLLGAAQAARTVAPLLVFGPAAIWMAVSADGVFAAISGWGLCCLAAAATRDRGWSTALWGVAAGTLLGLCLMLSYGLALLAVLAVAILLVARSFRPLPWVLVAAVVVVLGFAAAGYAWWEAFPVLRERYWDGIAGRRPATYWLWGNLAALCFSAGPLAAAGTAVGLARFRERRPLRAPPELGASSSARGNVVPNGQRNARGITSPYSSEQTVAVLACAAVLTIVIADLSRMSKAEVERIWLPFVPWLLLGCALLPPRWQRASLALQVAFALAVQHLLFTAW
ncbi:MAG: hypothetical protein WKF73_00310 [Nocardioidaceae bacterium]